MLATAHFRLKAIHGDNEETLYATIVLLQLVRNTEYVEMDYQDVSDLENVLHVSKLYFCSRSAKFQSPCLAAADDQRCHAYS